MTSGETRDLPYYMNLPYEVSLEPDEEGGWVATVPLLKGCISYGETEADAQDNIREAQELWIETALEHGWDIPNPLETGRIHETFDVSQFEIWLDLTHSKGFEAFVVLWRQMKARLEAWGGDSTAFRLRITPYLHRTSFHDCAGVIIDGARIPVVTDYLIPTFTTGDQGDLVTTDVWMDIAEEDGDDA